MGLVSDGDPVELIFDSGLMSAFLHVARKGNSEDNSRK